MRQRAEIAKQLDDHAYWFEHYRRTFLMLDLFPENKDRFRLTYEECMAAGA